MGRSQDFSAEFQSTMHPRCGHTALRTVSAPDSLLYTASLCTPPAARVPARGDVVAVCTSPRVTRSMYCRATFAFSAIQVEAERARCATDRTRRPTGCRRR